MNTEKIRTSYHEGNNDLLILTGEEDMEGIEREVPCTTVMIDGFDRDDAMTPWPGAVFKGRDFSGHGDALVQYILSMDVLQRQWDHIWAGGYSLAGLFSLLFYN